MHFDLQQSVREGQPVKTAESCGLCLVGMDGTQFNLLNRPQINAVVAKVKTRRGAAAFGKLSFPNSRRRTFYVIEAAALAGSK